MVMERITLASANLQRDVVIDFYLPNNVAHPGLLSLLLINDGQDLPAMHFSEMLDGLLAGGPIGPVLCAGIHCGVDRRMEYGTAHQRDYTGRGAKAKLYEQFILQELLPYIPHKYRIPHFKAIAFAGFSLGGLSALDIAWNFPKIFSTAAVFSGSLWWRSRGLEAGYNEDTDRIMHAQIRRGSYHANQKFYFTTGALDETADRNNNGIIDSIDDTLALIAELQQLGFTGKQIAYVNYEDGRHDVPTWGRAMPAFFAWAFPRLPA